MASSLPVETLESFVFDRVLREDAQDGSIVLLGALNSSPTIVSLHRSAFDVNKAAQLTSSFARLQQLGTNDCYHWFMAWFGSQNEDAHAKVNVISPATEVHIRKHSDQTMRMVRETPYLYKQVVLPYIESLPVSRIQWVYNILDHVTESDRIVYEDADNETGFLIIPDLKWDQKTISSLYVQAIVRNRSIRSVRDLRTDHLPLLRKINTQGRMAVAKRYGVHPDELRLFVHYQPSYYHLHVHMLHVSLRGYAGSTTGQSHLLDDIVDNLQMDESSNAEPYYARRIFTYAIGSQHSLYESLANAVHHQ